MALYEKIQVGKSFRYKEHIPTPINMPYVEQKQMITLLYTLTISMLMSVEKQLPAHTALARKIRGVEDAIKALAKLNAGPMDEVLVDHGVGAWNAAICELQRGLSGGI